MLMFIIFFFYCIHLLLHDLGVAYGRSTFKQKCFKVREGCGRVVMIFALYIVGQEFDLL